jgi:HEAT repeats
MPKLLSMGVFAQDAQQKSGSVAEQPVDPRLTATPDYGTLGPDSDFAKTAAGLPPSSPGPASGAKSNPVRAPRANVQLLRLIAVMGGILCAVLTSGRRPAWEKIVELFTTKNSGAVSSAKFSERELERQRPQKQAEILLTRAVSRSVGANDEIQAHVDSWRGKLRWDSQLSDLTAAALNSSDERVRASGIEVQLAAYGLSKSNPTMESLVIQANSTDRAQKIWALWALGLLGNRGVETERVVQVLSGHMKDSGKGSEESRRWAVEGLALVGTTPTITPLLDAMHNDASPLVRERAACSLAESGMLTHEQRLIAVPQLINFSDDPALDAQTHGWAFQALHDITKQPLPNDSAAWRNWYQSSGIGGQ